MLDYINEAFRKLSLLQEEVFETSPEGLNNLSNFLDNDEDDDIVKVIDPDVETDEELSDSYIGKVIINCNICHSNIFKSKEDVVIDGEGGVNTADCCPYCGEQEGFTIIGEVTEFVEHTDEIQVTTDGEPEVDTNNETPVEDEETNDLDEGLIGAGIGALAGSAVGKLAGSAVGGIGRAVGSGVGMVVGSGLGSKIQDNLKEEADSSIYDNVTTLYDELKKFLINKGYNVSTKEGRTYLWSAVDYIQMARESDTSYSIDKWFNDTKENYPEDLKLFESTECQENTTDCDEGLLGSIGGAVAGSAVGGALGKAVGGGLGKVVGNVAGSIAGGSIGSKIQDKISESSEDQLNEADLTQIEGTVAEVLNRHSVEIDDLAYSEAAVKDFVSRVLRDECKYENQAEEAIRKINSCRGGKLWSTIGTYMTGIKVVNDKNKKLYASVEDETTDQELTEDVNNVNVETDDTIVSVSADESGKVTVTTEPNTIEPTGEEMIEPVSDDTMNDLETQNNIVDEPTEDEFIDAEPSEDDEIDIDIEEADEESINDLGEAYLTKVYENVKSFTTTDMYISDNDSNLIVEGLITFNSGATKKTGFIFEPSVIENNKVRFTGKNEHFSRGNKSFTLVGTVENKKLIAESLTYNYRAKNANGSNRVYGTVKRG